MRKDAPPAPSELRRALAGGDPAEVAALVTAGADPRYRAEHGYDALIDAVHGRDVARDPRLPALLRLLIGYGVALDSVSSYQESALRVLSRLGRFDAVSLLLGAGADAQQLGWMPLHRAAALGTLADVQRALDEGAVLEAPDWWSRPALHIAILADALDKADLLLRQGASVAARARCGKPLPHVAVESRSVAALDWVLAHGGTVDDTDDFGTTGLMLAAECDDVAMVDALLAAGATVDHESNGGTALARAWTATVARRLLDAGGDPAHLAQEGRRALIGLPPSHDIDALARVTAEEFLRARSRRFGRANPEPIDEPFWIAMIRAGVSGYEATRRFNGPSSMGSTPVWCAQRFGQTLTFLPDGRIVQVGGEHEDGYDPDFCIYNDVFVHDPAGSVTIYAYPEDVFPPTDFHTATLVGRYLWLIGSLGYAERRRPGHTQVLRLDTRDFSVAPVATRGASPGWLSRHRAVLVGDESIRVSGGRVATGEGGRGDYTPSSSAYVLDLRHATWRRED